MVTGTLFYLYDMLSFLRSLFIGYNTATFGVKKKINF